MSFSGNCTRPVVVRAVRGQRRQAVGVVIGAHEMVRRGLRRGVRAVRRVGRRFAERRIGWRQRSVDLVGGHVHEAKRLAFRGRKRRPPRARRVEQAEGADDVRLDERRRAVDRPVDVRFRREIDDRPRAVLRQQRRHERAVADVAAHELMPGIAGQRLEVAQVAGVGEQVEIDHRLPGRGEPVQHEVGADEAGTAGDEDHVGSGFDGTGGRQRASATSAGILHSRSRAAVAAHR